MNLGRTSDRSAFFSVWTQIHWQVICHTNVKGVARKVCAALSDKPSALASVSNPSREGSYIFRAEKTNFLDIKYSLLGLNIFREIDLHQGKITIIQDNGAVFRFLVPKNWLGTNSINL
jgi:hypothetical protein